jgi:aspartyl-tRNA(Asn)/glutamyl-tRNA(Gln) amidotransferase subunit B
MSKQYYTTIGLEIHAELNTKSKMFCGCVNNPDIDMPNVNICPVCMAHPGTLPVINKQAVENVIKVGLALGANIADFTEFDRKNYFYPDIPKAYQISQYKYPIVSGGQLHGVKITRVHLEEDTANNKHDRGNYSLVDFNRAGVPLMELVTEPVIHSAQEAAEFGRSLQLLFRYLGVSEANMEKGQMRVELNISVSDNPDVFGTKVEVKNINSFRSVERAAEYEIKRMTELLEEGKGAEIVQETRGWDENKQSTFSQRSKENANDYRYFPDPDLPKLYLSKAFDIEKLRSLLPELPEAKRDRFRKKYGLKDADVEIFIVDRLLSDYFEAVAEGKDQVYAQTAANYLVSDYLGIKKANPEAKLPELAHFRELIDLVVHGGMNAIGRGLTSRGAKNILGMIVIKSAPPRALANEHGLLQENDEGALKEIAQKIIDANPGVVETYKGGKENALMSLVGQIMKETKGSANPALVQKILKELLS